MSIRNPRAPLFNRLIGFARVMIYRFSPDGPNPNPAYPPSFGREPEIWGALYAVEGSRLGNRVILRRVMECGSGAERRATQFLAHGLEDRTAWRGFLARLEALQYCGEAFELAVLGAERVFQTYLDLAGRHLR